MLLLINVDYMISGKTNISKRKSFLKHTSVGEQAFVADKTNMAAVYHKSRNDASVETTRLGPIADTIVTTLAQDNLFTISFVIVEILGVLLLILCMCWMFSLGGFGFDNAAIFNFHPILMTLGMVFLNANGNQFIYFSMNKLMTLFNYRRYSHISCNQNLPLSKAKDYSFHTANQCCGDILDWIHSSLYLS